MLIKFNRNACEATRTPLVEMSMENGFIMFVWISIITTAILVSRFVVDCFIP